MRAEKRLWRLHRCRLDAARLMAALLKHHHTHTPHTSDEIKGIFFFFGAIVWELCVVVRMPPTAVICADEPCDVRTGLSHRCATQSAQRLHVDPKIAHDSARVSLVVIVFWAGGTV